MTQLRSASAFTLIELLVAVAISSVILLVSVTAFQAVDRSYRRAMEVRAETRLLVTSYETAIREADSWLAVDDPALAATTTELRALRQSGRPLAPLSMPREAWRSRPHDPRWWHGGGARGPLAHDPRYFPDHWPQGNRLAFQSGPHFAAADPRRFLPDLQDRLYREAGIAALAGYLPRGIPLGYFSATGAGGRSWDVFRPGKRPTENFGYFNHAHIQYAWAMQPRLGSWNWPAVGVGAAGSEGWITDLAARLPHDLAILLPPRPGWSSDNALDPDNLWARDELTQSLLYARKDERWRNAIWSTRWGDQGDDAFTTGHPSVYRIDDQEVTARGGVLRFFDGSGWHSEVRLKVVDTSQDQWIDCRFPILATSLRGARMRRGLDQIP
jgi:prepilin-type N-terminal cleavage/methylation domain-containing protein